jgi:hypothetical protein
MRRVKRFFRERPEPDGDLYVEFKEAIEREGGALMAGVFRGRMSEGIDFYDDQARAVIAFGIPYPPVNDLEVRLKREYNDAHDEGPNGREWYDAQAFRSLWQATGRCLRHAGDYGTVVLIDSRFPGHIERFPRWMRASFKLDTPVPDIVEELGRFFREMAERFPTKQVFHAGRPAILACAACGRRVVEVEGIGAFECVTLARREGLRRVLDGERGDGCMFLTKPQLSGNVALGEVRFEGDDLAAYAAVVCACGEVLGAKMVAGTTDEIAMFDGVWILLAKVTGTQGSVKARLDAVLVPKASLKLAVEGKGQRVLAYIEDD